MINVILADPQSIYRIGMASMLAAEEDIRIISQPYSIAHLLSGLGRLRADVLVLSASYISFLTEIQELAQRQQTAILLLADPEDSVSQYFKLDVEGLLRRSAPASLMAQAIRRLARGERVIYLSYDKGEHVSQDETGIPVRRRLTPREFRIIGAVVQGYKNREIASRMGTSEQMIKNALRKIFDKTGVSDRLELALFVLHNHTLMKATISEPTSLAVAPGTGKMFPWPMRSESIQ